jgi:HK97 family phage major capsid protein
MKELRDKLRAKLNEARAILTKATGEKRGLTPEEQGQYDGFKAAAEAIKAEIRAHEESAALQAELDAIAPETQAGQRSDPAPEPRNGNVYVEPVAKPEKGDALGAIISARYRFGQDTDAAKRWAAKAYGESSPQARAMQQTVFTSGGALIAENWVGAELIELLRAQAAVRRAGARSIPLVNGSATIPKITGGATAYWGAEGDNITASEMTTGEIKLTEKKLTCLVPLSNDLLKNGSLATDRLVRDDMVVAAANAEDVGFLKGPGTGSQPKGIYYWVGDPGRTNSAGTSLANVRTDIRVSLNRLGNANAPMQKRAWFIHSRAKHYLAWDLVDGNSNFAFPELRNGNSLADAPVQVDNNISIVLGAGTDTEVYYAEMSECFIGDNGALELELFANAAYVDAGGTLRSGISRDESVIRLIRKTDFAMRHVESAHVLEAVAWGA